MTESVDLEVECKRLHEQSLRALEDELRADQEHRAAEEKIEQLQCQCNSLLGCSIDKTGAATKVLEEYAKVACRKLCEDVYGAFPREVRDIIYGHLHAYDEVQVSYGVRDWSLDDLGPPSYFTSCSEKHWQKNNGRGSDRTKDLWWDSCCVGENMLRELSEHYYRTTLFLFENDCKILPKFRIADQWGLGFVPGEVATNVGISVDCASYDFAGKSCEELSLDFEHLFGFKAGTNISIKFSEDKFRERCFLEAQQWMCANVIPVLLPTLRRLKVAGYKLKIVLCGKNCGDTQGDFTIPGSMLDMDAIQTSFAHFTTRALEKIQLKKDAEEERGDFEDVGDDDEENEEGESS